MAHVGCSIKTKKGNKMKYLLAIVLLLMSAIVIAEGSKNKNPLDSVTLTDGCVLVFATGVDEEQCTAVPSPSQSGSQFICEVLMICGRDD